MDGNEFYKYAKPCNDNQIFIFPKASNSGKYKIIICDRGKEKVGNEVYEDVAVTKINQIMTTTGPQKVKEIIPSVWDKIFELYKAICLKHNLKPLKNENRPQIA